MATQLYHVGCGQPLFTTEQLKQGTLALACRCGASSPIAVPDLRQPAPPDTPSIPASLIRLLAGVGDPPHLEAYLGFTNFECPAQTFWSDRLRALGCVSMANCTEERCRVSYAHRRLKLLNKVK